MNTTQSRTKLSSRDPIAITGISCRFPKVSTLDDFWELLVQGKDTIDEIKRWNIDEYFDADKTAKNKTHQRHSSLFDNVDDFDPFFFNISPAEAAEMTPSQKLLLELAWEAIENSSIPFEKIMGQKAGVYIGNIWSDFEHLRKHKNAEITLHSSVGQSSNVIANRVSYFLGLTGPSLIVDTGCSTSLVALHLACQGLWEGNIKFALAGGINHILDPDQNLLLSKFGGLSAKGMCSTFDRDVDGFVRGEGAGLLLLKRLSDAERDGDHIYAVIRGSAMNNNGYNINLPATSTKGQLDVLKEAYEGSGIDPGEVHYVETHGTGTKLGDPTECNAIGQFFGSNRKKPLAIGSVKTNLGHTEGAAGMAGLIKTVLSMNKGLIPKNLNFKTPNPEIDFEGLSLAVQKENTAWPTLANETLKAGVNSFGWGGTNAHTLIEEYRAEKKEVEDQLTLKHGQLVLPLSAKSDQALKAYAKSFKAHLQETSEEFFTNSLISASVRKPKLSHGRLIFGKDQKELLAGLDEVIEASEVDGVELDASNVVFVFPGQGSQWLGMGKELYTKEPVFKQSIDACDEAFREYVDWSLIDQMRADESTSRLSEIEVIQPALFAMQVSLAKLWISFGVNPASVVGHSMGEVAAAYISGALDLKDAANVICTRSKLMQTVSGQGGAMAVTELTVTDAEDYIKKYEGLSVAVSNSPKSTVIAGEQNEITDLLDSLESKGLFCKQVKVDVASHSKQMDPLKEPLRAALKTLEPNDNAIKLFSTVRDGLVEGKRLDADYWVDNLRQSVRFSSTMEKLLKEEHTIFIEVSPHPVLVTAMQECFEAFEQKAVATPTLLRNKSEVGFMYQHFSDLYNKGLSVDWNTFYNDPQIPYTSVPGYPFQRATYEVTENKLQKQNGRKGHVLIGEELKIANNDGIQVWRTNISLEDFEYLSDRKVFGKILVPESFYLEMVQAAVTYVLGNEEVILRNVLFNEATVLLPDTSTEIQIKVFEKEERFELFSLSDEKWMLCVSGGYHRLLDSVSEPDEIFTVTDKVNVEGLYNVLQKAGFEYESMFVCIESILANEYEAEAEIRVPQKIQTKLKDHFIHPALLEACLQTTYTFLYGDSEGVQLSPHLVEIEKIKYAKQHLVDKRFTVQTRLQDKVGRSSGRDKAIILDLIVLDHLGEVCLELIGLKVELKMAPSSFDHFYRVKWVSKQLKETHNKFGDITLLIEENNRLSEALIEELNDKEVPVTIIQTKNDMSWSGLRGWETTDHVVYFANSTFDKVGNHLNLDSSNQISKLFEALDSATSGEVPKVTILTRSAIPFENRHLNFNHASFAGLTRVLANEYPKYAVSMVDTSNLPSYQEMVTLVKFITQALDYEPQISLRGGDIYAARFSKAEVIYSNNTSFSQEKCHVFVGANKQALLVMDWMLDRGATNFSLLCEDDMIGFIEENAGRLIEKGAVIQVHPYSRKERSSIYKVFESLDEVTEVESIFYFDKVENPSDFENELSTDFMRQIKTRTNEAWLLHEIAEKEKVKYFTLIASDGSLLGEKGNAMTASTGAFLNALSSYRLKLGLPSSLLYVASNQGKEAKNSCSSVVNDTMQKDALSIAFSQPLNGLGIMKIEPNKMASCAPALSKSNFISGSLISKSAIEQDGNSIDKYHHLTSDEEKVEVIVEFLLGTVAKIIKSSVDSISPKMKFKSLGVDSLMAVQFRNKIESGLKIKLSIGNIWSHPNAEKLAEFLHSLISKASNEVVEQEVRVKPEVFVDKVSDRAVAQLICFHDAGGSASLFGDWVDSLGNTIELIRVELPGRKGGVFNANLTPDIASVISIIADDLVKLIDKPSIFIGHSMGGLFAFEVIHELRKRKFDLPEKLYVSSTPQLNSYDRTKFDPNMTDEELVVRFPYLSEKNTQDRELRTFLRAILRMDLKLLDTFKYQKKENLDLDIICVRGENDETVSKEQMLKWEQEINGTLLFLERPGDHHYIKKDRDFMTDLILDGLTSNLVLPSI